MKLFHTQTRYNHDKLYLTTILFYDHRKEEDVVSFQHL